MADDKKYYYLKLKDNFFDSDQAIILESMPDGYLYSNILLKLYLRSLKYEGKLMFNERIPYNSTILAQVTRHSVGVIEKALRVFEDLELIEVLDNGAIYMLDIQNFIGSSSTEADRKRLYRASIDNEKLKIGQTSGQMSTQTSEKYPPEKEKEKEIEKDIKNNSASDEAQLLFEELWKLYPVKKGKGQISLAAKKKLVKIGRDKMIRCLERYKAFVEKTDYLNYKNGSTFFKTGYIDYLDENYEDTVPKQKPTNNKFNDYKQSDTDYEALETKIMQARFNKLKKG